MSRRRLAAFALMSLLAACGERKPADSPPAAPPPAAVPAPAPAATASAVPAGWKTYSDPALGIAFDYAPDRHTDGCGDVGEGVVCIGLFGPGKGGEGEALIYFQPVDGPLDTVAKEQAGFEKNAQGVLMTTWGRFEPVPVEPFTARGGPGLKAVVTCGIDDAETGFHAAGGECLWAVVGDGTRAVVATTQGRIGLDPDTMTTLNSVRFVPKG